MCLSLLLMKLRVTVQKIVLKNIHIIILYVKTGLKYTKFLGWVDRSEIGTAVCLPRLLNLGHAAVDLLEYYTQVLHSSISPYINKCRWPSSVPDFFGRTLVWTKVENIK